MVDGIVKRLEACAAKRKAFVSDWREWAKGHRKSCVEHAGQHLPIDEDASLEASWFAAKNVLVFGPCPKCHAARIERECRAALIKAGVPDNLCHATLENFHAETPEEREALARVKDYAEKACGFLCLFGRTFGTGKSHLAVAVLRAVGRGRFLTQADFLRALRRTYNDMTAPDIVPLCQAASLLVLDEIGMSGGGQDELPALHEVLNYRYGHKKPTVLTGNITTAAEFTRILGPRLEDRMSEAVFARIVLEGKSKRASRRQSYIDHQPGGQ